jgi:thiol-disulfide isomerase/thioredoxin
MHTRLIVIFIFLLALVSCGESSTGETSAKTNDAKVTTQTTMDGDNTPGQLAIYENFEELEHIFNYKNDTTYVINFWATWCKPCVAELPYFDDLYKEYKEDKLKIILVSLDFPKQIETKLKPFIKNNNVLPEVKMLKDSDINGWGAKVSEEWDGAIPITLIYNKDKKLFVSGELHDYADLKDRVSPLL